MLKLGMAVALGIFVCVEYIRLFRLWPMWKGVSEFLVAFLDERDKRGVIFGGLIIGSNIITYIFVNWVCFTYMVE
jgi:hypothetical protein